LSRRARTVAVVAALVAVAGAGAATLGLGGGGGPEREPDRTGPATTVAVTRQTLVESVSLTGELSYGRAIPLASTTTGTVTWLPEVGATVRRGEPLLRADELPVVLLYGPLPMYRPLADGVEGTDVAQFERNLAELGYDGFTVDEKYSASTVAAVKRWQKDLGLAETGTVERAQVVSAPGAVRIAEHLVRVGASATGDMVSYTGNTRVVDVAASAGEAAWAAKGTGVTVALPGGGTVAGKVTSVAAPAAAGEAPAADAPPTVEITIAIANQKALGKVEKGPVTVRYVAQKSEDVLTVPVSALLALAEGGYGLEVVSPTGPRVVTVEVGLFAEGRVEVSGDGLADGAQVGVPE
jgi:peptidoglycan hydrolase-like protein with peptidoglycan-binding domain